MIETTLSPNEIHMGACHGVLRRTEKHQGKRSDRVQKEDSSWDNEINGALAELAFCKTRGIYWSGCVELRAKDAGSVEVRWTRHKDKGGLIIYDHDADDAMFILMDGFAPTYRIIGWISGADAKLHSVKHNFGNLCSRDRLHPANKTSLGYQAREES